MLIKYYGLVLKNEMEFSLRDEFLTNGLFRVTQPKFLNDKGSEGRLYPYFNKFSPADYEWARKEDKKSQTNLEYIPSNDELEKFYLEPFTQRYGDSLPHVVKSQTGHESMAEYDKEVFEKSVAHINQTIVELLSCTIGILSLSKTDTNEHMWTHYASEGKGIALEFDDQNDFFNKNKPKNVSYNELDRAFITYFKGMIRFNGIPIDEFKMESNNSTLEMLHLFSQKDIDAEDFTKRLLYAKSESWKLENEARIVFDLNSSDRAQGKIRKPDVSDDVLNMMPSMFSSYSEVYLKKIPFSAFKSLIFGYDTEKIIQDEIINKVKSNPELEHLIFKKVKHNIYGKLETVSIVV